MKREWAATTKPVYVDHELSKPSPPDGAGWRLVGVVPIGLPGNTGVVFYWERDVPTWEREIAAARIRVRKP